MIRLSKAVKGTEANSTSHLLKFYLLLTPSHQMCLEDGKTRPHPHPRYHHRHHPHPRPCIQHIVNCLMSEFQELQIILEQII